MEETRALLPDGPAPKARPTYRRDALCFALGCATAAMVLVAFDLPSALSSDSARAPAALSADEKMKAGTASQIAALKAQSRPIFRPCSCAELRDEEGVYWLQAAVDDDAFPRMD